VAGAYTGSALENNGERITLVDADGAVIQDFTYDDTGDGWHPTTDGGGFSLVVVNELSDPDGWSSGGAWRPSFEVFGSPGERDMLLGDFDLNNRVDAADLAYLQSRLGTASGAAKLTGDLTGEGAVDRNDARQFASRFGRFFTPPPSPAASSAVPAAELASASGSSPRVAARALRATRSRLAPQSPRLDAAATDAVIQQTMMESPLARRPLRAIRTAVRPLVIADDDLGRDSLPYGS